MTDRVKLKSMRSVIIAQVMAIRGGKMPNQRWPSL